MGSIAEFYDHHKGKFIDAVEVSAHCVWAAKDIGKADFELVKKGNSKVTERLTRPGNRVRIRKPRALNLPDWYGVLDDDNGWVDGKIKITAKTPHQLYNWRDARVMKKNGVLYEDTAGAVVNHFIDLCNSFEDLRIRPGNIFVGGDKVQETLDSFLYDNIRSIADKGYYWQFRPVFGSDKGLLFYFDFTQQLGKVVKNVKFIEGHNFEKAAGQQILRQVGPIINQFAGLSDSSTDEERITIIEEDALSIQKYGLRQSAEVFTGVTVEATVVSNTKALLSLSKSPRNVPSIIAQNVDNLFQKIRLGNVLGLVYKESGWNTLNGDNVQITVMDHTDQIPQKMTLTADVMDE